MNRSRREESGGPEAAGRAERPDHGIDVTIPSWITPASIAAIVAGFALGIVAHAFPAPGWDAVGGLLAPVGQAWINALLMILVPLLGSILMLAVADGGGRGAARVGVVTLAVMLGYMILGSLFTFTVGPALISLLPLDPGAIQAAQSAASDFTLPAGMRSSGSGSVGEWIVNLVPANPLRSAVEGDIMGIVIAALVFGLGVRRIGDRGEVVIGFLRGVRSAAFTIAVWILMALPLGAFALSYGAGMTSGGAMAGAVVLWIVAICSVTAALIGIVYVVTAVLGDVPILDFTRASLPAQSVAVSSRSSLASLPAMMESARRMGLPEEVYGLSLPLTVSTFKLNNAASSLLKLLFLATIYGVTLDPGFVATFIAARIVLSLATPGLPAGTTMLMLPFYVSAGIPVEGYLLLKPVQAIPDLLFTPLNVTADLSVAVIARRVWKNSHDHSWLGLPADRPGVATAE